jgi:hypothetical protein
MRSLGVAWVVVLPAVMVALASPAHACSTVAGPLEDCSGANYASYRVHTVVGCVLAVTVWHQVGYPFHRGVEIVSTSESDFCAPEPQGVRVEQITTADGFDTCIWIQVLVADVDECWETTP